MIKSRLICEMKLPYEVYCDKKLPHEGAETTYKYGKKMSCLHHAHGKHSWSFCLMLEKEGFQCCYESKYLSSCTRITPSGETRIDLQDSKLDRFKLIFFKRQINEELEKMRREHENC